MNKQLLRLKRRSDDSVLNIAECDDSDNLYVNVAQSTPISISNWPSSYDTHNYMVNANGTWVNSRGSLQGYTLVKETQSSIQIAGAEQALTWADSAPQFLGKTAEFTLPSGDIQSKYILYVTNPSPDTALNLSVRNILPIGDVIRGGEIFEATVPISSNTLFSGTAWSSCFTSIGGVLTDESGDINDTNVGADVPFSFAAADDAIYFGAIIPFERVRLNIGTAGTYVGTTIWEYWDGSAWSPILIRGDNSSLTDMVNGTKSFTRIGYRSIAFQKENDWTAYDIAGNPTSQYWVRCRIATFTSIAVAPAFIQGWYKRVGDAAVHAYVIEGLWNGGDVEVTLENATAIPALSGFTSYILIKRL